MAKDRTTTADLRRVAERVLKLAKAEGVDHMEVDAGTNTDALTRFANNTIHQNVAEHTVSISVRAIFDGRTARATTNKTDDDSLRRVVAAAASLAKNQPKNPDLLPSLGEQKYQKVARYFASTAETTPQDRARAVTKVCRHAGKNKQTAAGIFVSGGSHSVMANSRGLFAHYRQTRAEFSITILETDSSGWAKANSPDIRKIDPVVLAESGITSRFSNQPPCSIWWDSFSSILAGRRSSTNARVSPAAWARNFSAKTLRFGTTSTIRCKLAGLTTAKARRARKSC
jgi:predicted Zn-dependent protease